MLDEPDLLVLLRDPAQIPALVSALVVVDLPVVEIVLQILFVFRPRLDRLVEIDPSRRALEACIGKVVLGRPGVVEEVALIDDVPLDLRVALVPADEHQLHATDAADRAAPCDCGRARVPIPPEGVVQDLRRDLRAVLGLPLRVARVGLGVLPQLLDDPAYCVNFPLDAIICDRRLAAILERLELLRRPLDAMKISFCFSAFEVLVVLRADRVRELVLAVR